MAREPGLWGGATATLVLKLLEEGDLYGYQMIERLEQRSDKTFQLKAGTLYPLLHKLENEGAVESYERPAEREKVRKYYHLTKRGKELLAEKQAEWTRYSGAVNQVLQGGLIHAGT